MFNEFEKEQNELLENLVFNNIYPKLTVKTQQNLINGQNKLVYFLELYLTSHCNKKCEYCYLTRYAKELYPQEYDKPEIILKNLKILLNSFIERGYAHINRVDIFSGEILGTKFGYDVLDVLLNYIRHGFIIDNLIIPTNGSFLYDDKAYLLIQDYIDAFQILDCHLQLSFSYDGYIVENENRPFNNSKKEKDDDKFLQRLKELHTFYDFGFHPMINASTIDKQIENFNWWKDFLKSCNEEDVMNYVMMLEVRNNDWTTESIYSYLKWMKYIMEYQYNEIIVPEDGKPSDFVDFCLGQGEILIDKSYTYVPYRFLPNKQASCGFTQGFCVRLGDMAICPCHRTAYDKLLIGKFIVENNKIIGIQAINPMMAINSWFTGHSSWIKCDACSLKDYCIKGCVGSQFETNREPFYPIDCVCEHALAKQMYTLINLVHIIDKYNIKTLQDEKMRLTRILNNIKKDKKEKYLKWERLIHQIMLEI